MVDQWFKWELVSPILWTATTVGSLVAGVVGYIGGRVYNARARKLAKDIDELRFTTSARGYARRDGPADADDDDELHESGSQAKATLPAATSALAVVVPDGLIEALNSGHAVLYLGAEVGEIAGAPGLRELLRRLIGRLTPAPEASELRSLERAISNGKLDYAAEYIRRRMDEAGLRASLIEMFARAGTTGAAGAVTSPAGTAPSSVLALARDAPYAQIARLNVSAVLTSTWDSALLPAFRKRSPLGLTPGGRVLEEVLRGDPFYFLQLCGDLGSQDPLLFTQAERERALRRDSVYVKLIGTLAASRPFIFMGATLEEMDLFFGQLDMPTLAKVFALVAHSPQQADWALLAERVRAKCQAELVEYVPTPGHGHLLVALEQMSQRTSAPVGGRRRLRPERRRLAAVRLTNIGPFKSVSVDVNPGWNVILGNNASGKSTILKAIALGLCGEDVDAQRYAGRLLRAGADEGVISLRVGKETYETRLIRDLNRVRAECRVLTPVQKGRWVALGFPPLRGLSRNDPKGPSSLGLRQPQVGDLLPLLSGGVDSRLDDLKQWIVNAYVTERGLTFKSKPSLLESFFAVLRDLAPSENIALNSVESGSWRVLVDTDDGTIPLEQVSQGMTSVIGWVGTLLQRMFEIYPDSEHPQKEPALVLVDEIDAHLHPAWQRILVGLIRKHFDALQIVATTHSPLVVVGLEPHSVLVARRDPGDAAKIELARASDDKVEFEGMRADQVLTSPLFGLTTTRGEREWGEMHRYAQLLGRERTADESVELEGLRAKMNRWTQDGEGRDGRARAQEPGTSSEELDLSVANNLSAADQARVAEGMARVLGKKGDAP